jgi:glycerol-3-phosphate O-acyltransferase
LIHAALTANEPNLVVVPVAIAYDLVLEDHILAKQGVKKLQRPFTRELAELVRYAVGYWSRAFVTFGSPIPVGDIDPQSRSDVLALTRLIRTRIGAIYKVLPTAVFASAMRPSVTRRDLEARIDRILDELSARQANLGVTSGRQAIDEAAEPLETRGIVVLERGRFRVRDRNVLKYYARTIEHLLATPGRTH